MNITDVTRKVGGHRRRARVGRGEGSGMGKTCGRGAKGGGQRAGWSQRLWHEGGAFPLFRRVAKRGFNNFGFRTDYQVVNVGLLARRCKAGDHVTAAVLAEAGLIPDAKAPLKILGDGEIGVQLTVEAERFSGEAARKIEASGGTIKRLGPQPAKKFVKRRPPKPEPSESEKGGEKKEGKKKAKGGGEASGAAAKGGKKPKEPREPKEPEAPKAE